MTDNILIGEGAELRREPESAWRQELASVLETPSPRLEFMSRAHHRVRDTVVSELPRHGKPMPSEAVADVTGLALGEVEPILAELERRLFFLSRNDEGAVSWAYPVTVEPTAHRLQFTNGESMYAA
jgi:hypothetical protein